ncbi:MAG: tRNA 2-thiouridine(34) synthase MnmA [Lactobacillaceae bacterium]|jgi:tRNA-specific 2-thiouridylase|nr:tRNA 2-thiouridine(34) synthase MnmA [Lactobacillaceae bacterium]
MGNGKRVLAGLSGGVDSSLAALLLKEQGYDVIGATMAIFDKSGPIGRAIGNACYDAHEKDDIEETKAIAAKIGIPFIVCDCVDDYKKLILKYFREEYLAGRTPNPCVKCNYLMKFGILPEMVKKQGVNFDFFATGHYAQVEYSDEYEQYVLKKGIDPKKDQSYFLYRLSQEQLSTIILPMGKFTKAETRKMAKERGLEVHDKPDSQDFYSGDYNDIIGEPEREGNIVDKEGNILGKHKGFWNYTLGQRKGLGIAFSEPLYVIGLNPKQNEVIAGIEENTFNKGCIVKDASFILPIPQGGEKLQAKIRSSQQPCEVIITKATEKEFEIEFVNMQKAVAPGQSCVLYKNDLVVGGGIISARI